MDVSNRTSALTCAKERVFWTSSSHPAESALLLCVLSVSIHDGWDLLELFPLFVDGVREDRV